MAAAFVFLDNSIYSYRCSDWRSKRNVINFKTSILQMQIITILLKFVCNVSSYEL